MKFSIFNTNKALFSIFSIAQVRNSGPCRNSCPTNGKRKTSFTLIYIHLGVETFVEHT